MTNYDLKTVLGILKAVLDGHVLVDHHRRCSLSLKENSSNYPNLLERFHELNWRIKEKTVEEMSDDELEDELSTTFPNGYRVLSGTFEPLESDKRSKILRALVDAKRLGKL